MGYVPIQFPSVLYDKDSGHPVVVGSPQIAATLPGTYIAVPPPSDSIVIAQAAVANTTPSVVPVIIEPKILRKLAVMPSRAPKVIGPQTS